ncbi:hypothetical protein UN64_10345 [Fictibacillus arsenicus]|uniref:Uncharacterized protein n=1 Tax=Fictibacillus arsenicus TaxID=255247 RepID=A0A1V3G9Q6_9BACL|nr:hypothetical protein UN64_10345 [Fictibacillus arsenicus]
MVSFYSRLLPKLHAKEDKGIQIYCIESLELKKQIDTFEHNIFNYFSVYVEADIEAFLSLTSESEKKKRTLEIVHEGMKKAAQGFNCELHVLENIYNRIKQADYENTFLLLKKSSPNKKYICNIKCHHEVSSIDVYVEIKKRNGTVVNSEKLFSLENTDEQDLFSDYGILEWKLNHKVEFADKDYKMVYRLTFLEKDKPENLVWKIERNLF